MELRGHICFLLLLIGIRVQMLMREQKPC